MLKKCLTIVKHRLKESRSTMTKKNHGVFWGLLLGSAAASIAYLSLSSSKKDQLLKDSAKKIDDLNAYLQDKSKQVLDAVSEKVQESKDAVEVYGGIAAETVEESLGQAKEKVEGIGEATSQTIQSKMEKLTSDKTDADDEK
ncbi:hypothetical protein M1GAS476_0935 [Streptococcus pyogenes M1 476]|nr:hypothetical protein M1GAS476_0935 [Streptococcus pyogenes M1 476]